MEQQTFLQRLESLGYYMLPPVHPDSPGFTGLLVVLRQAPHGHEPERIQLTLHEWDGKSTAARLHADSNQPLSTAVCPSQIVIRSGQEQEATFYTFGGRLESEALAGETVYSLRSAAPILELVPERETIADRLAEETEVLFAQSEAELRLSTEELLDRLVKAGPEAVYQAVLHSLLTEEESTLGHHRPADFVHMLSAERRWYQNAGRWPLIPHDLDGLLLAMSED